MKNIILLLALTAFVIAAPRHPNSFNNVKEYSERLALYEIIENNHSIKTLYSQTPLKHTFKLTVPKFPNKPQIDIVLIPEEDIYDSSLYEKRSHIIEWEHVVPASWFKSADPFIKEVWNNGHPKCVTRSGNVYKGRRCAGKVSLLFKKMEADMYNLEPALGSINAIRNNYSFGIIPGEDRHYGDLIDFEIDRDRKIVEPTDSVRGKIGRIMLYMNKKYGVQFPDHNNTLKLIQEWNIQYPMTPWEIKKRQILKETYGYEF